MTVTLTSDSVYVQNGLNSFFVAGVDIFGVEIKETKVPNTTSGFSYSLVLKTREGIAGEFQLAAVENYKEWNNGRNGAIQAMNTIMAIRQECCAGGGGGGSVVWGGITGTLSDQTDLQAALDLKANKSISIRTYTGTTDTLVLTDAGNWVRGNNPAANVLVVPTNASVAFPIGTQIPGSQYGAGQMSIAPVSGTVTINSAGGALKLAARYSPFLLTKTGTNEWHLSGDITT